MINVKASFLVSILIMRGVSCVDNEAAFHCELWSAHLAMSLKCSSLVSHYSFPLVSDTRSNEMDKIDRRKENLFVIPNMAEQNNKTVCVEQYITKTTISIQGRKYAMRFYSSRNVVLLQA